MQIEVTRISPPLQYARLHQHGNWEIILNISGTGIEHIGDKEALFYPGSIALCPPNTTHDKHCTEPDGHFQDIFLRFSDPTHLFRPSAVWLTDDAGHSTETLMRILQNIYYGQDNAQYTVSNVLTETICKLLMTRESNGKADKITETVQNEIALHFTDPEFSLPSVYSAMNYSPDHIRRVFRKNAGMTPTAYLIRTRLIHAGSLLRSDPTGQYTVKEIAILSGFYDQEYFCRVFHRMFGLSPSQYRARQE